MHLLKKDNLNITEGRLIYLAQKTRYVNINDYILRGIGMSYETIDWQQNGHVVVATLNRPESLNAINQKMDHELIDMLDRLRNCLLYTSPSPRDGLLSRMPSSA